MSEHNDLNPPNDSPEYQKGYNQAIRDMAVALRRNGSIREHIEQYVHPNASPTDTCTDLATAIEHMDLRQTALNTTMESKREKAFAEETIKQWVKDFLALPLSHAREVATIWLSRLEEDVEQLKEIDDIHTLKNIAISARQRYLSGPMYNRNVAARAVDAAAEDVEIAFRALDDKDLEIPGVLRDAMALLKSGHQQIQNIKP